MSVWQWLYNKSNKFYGKIKLNLMSFIFINDNEVLSYFLKLEICNYCVSGVLLSTMVVDVSKLTVKHKKVKSL